MTSGFNSNFLISTNVGQTYDLGSVLYNTNTDAVTFNLTHYANKKHLIPYGSPITIKTSSVAAKLDGAAAVNQTVYFGPNQPPLWIAGGSDVGGNTVALSNDGINWQGVQQTIVNAVYGIDYDGIKWVITGNANTSSIAYSYDGGTWYAGTDVFPRISNSAGGAIAYNGTYWVGGGTSGGNSLAYSYDGINWVGLGTSVLTTCYGMATNGNVWVAVGTGTNMIAYTWDLTGVSSWTGVSGTTIFSTAGRAVKWNGQFFVAVGAGTTVAGISADGITWSSITVSPAIASSGLYSVGWDGRNWIYGSAATAPGLFVGDGNAYLLNGADQVMNRVNGLQWNGTLWVGAGTGGNTLVYSYNGSQWIKSANTVFISSANCVGYNNRRLNNIKFARKIIWAGGNGGARHRHLSWSFDGISWNNSGSNVFDNLIFTTVTNGKIWVSGAETLSTPGNTIGFSTNGNTWTGIPLVRVQFTSNFLHIAYNSYTFIGVGSTKFNLAVSQDGMSWTPIPFFKTLNANISRAGTWGNNMWLVGCDNGQIYFTRDPYARSGWALVNNQVFTSIVGSIKWNGHMFVAGGFAGTNTLAYSFDGLNWTGLGTATFSSDVRVVDWNGFMWVAAGTATSNRLAYSYNGITWTAGATSSLFPNYALGVRWVNNRWVAAGGATTTTTAYSSDGINWLASPTSPFGTYGDQIDSIQGEPTVYIQHPTVAGGTAPGNTLCYSPDGIQWRGLGSSVFSTACNGVAWNGIIWVACGQGGNTLAYSYDGLKWFGLGSPVFTTVGEAISWNGQYWVAGGSGGNALAYSLNGNTWTGLGVGAMTNVNGLAWNGLYWVAVGSGGNALAYSTNTTTWLGISGSATLLGTGTAVFSCGTHWLATGSSGGTATIAYTSDISGSTGWTAIPSSTSIFSATSSNGGYSICWNGIIWTAVGQGTNTIAYSGNGISWTGAGTSALTTNGRGVCWNGKRFIAVGAGTSPIAYSTDGITWYNPINVANLTSQFNCVASNPQMGTQVVDSAISNVNAVDVIIDGVLSRGSINAGIKIKSSIF